MWNKLDRELMKFEDQYTNINDKTFDDIQSIFDRTANIEGRATKTDISRFKRLIEYNYAYLSQYGQYKAKKYLRKRNITNADILLFSLFVIYSYEQYMLAPLQEMAFKNIGLSVFDKTIHELPNLKQPRFNVSAYVSELLEKPNSKGYIWKDYNDAMVEYNAEEVYRQAIQNIRANKPLDVNRPEFQKIFKRQHKRLINVNGKNISGAMDNEAVGIFNSVRLKTYEKLGIKRCRFIAKIDDKTTEMCKSLNGQIFNINDWNRFKRYNGTTGTYETYNIYGMLLGINLPPIQENYHCCRSTITYQVEDK